MSSSKSLFILALVVLAPLVSGCTSELGEIVGAGLSGDTEASPPGAGWTPRPGAVLTVSGAGSTPQLVLDEPAQIREVVAALPAAVRIALLRDGRYETDEPEVAQSHWRVVTSRVMDKCDLIDLQIEKVSWGKIKIVYG